MLEILLAHVLFRPSARCCTLKSSHSALSCGYDDEKSLFEKEPCSHSLGRRHRGCVPSGARGFSFLELLLRPLIYSVVRVFTTSPFFPTGMIQAINDVLFIVIILEILRTVIARYTDGVFQLQNFLIIGIIAAVRHILHGWSIDDLGCREAPREFREGSY